MGWFKRFFSRSAGQPGQPRSIYTIMAPSVDTNTGSVKSGHSTFSSGYSSKVGNSGRSSVRIAFSGGQVTKRTYDWFGGWMKRSQKTLSPKSGIARPSKNPFKAFHAAQAKAFGRTASGLKMHFPKAPKFHAPRMPKYHAPKMHFGNKRGKNW